MEIFRDCKQSTASITIEEIYDVSLQIEAIEEDGSFVNRLLRREELIDHSCYRTSFEAERLHFDWESEPATRKTGVTTERDSGHGILLFSPHQF